MGIIATDPSGLADSTTYYFKVNDVEYSITTSTGPTFQDVASLMDTALSGAGFDVFVVGVIPDQDIRVKNVGIKGIGSVCVLSQGATSPDLFSNLNFWSRFRFPKVNTAPKLDLIATVQGGVAITGGAAYTSTGEESRYYGEMYYGDGYYGNTE